MHEERSISTFDELRECCMVRQAAPVDPGGDNGGSAGRCHPGVPDVAAMRSAAPPTPDASSLGAHSLRRRK
jgi:hypothetical protein